MTREEAIKILEEEAEFLYGGDEPYNKIAFDMAIESLTYQNLSKPNNALKALSSAEAVQGCDGSRYDTRPPLKHGEWKYYNYYAGWYECTVCKQYENIKHKFCPNCGADMRGDKHV